MFNFFRKNKNNKEEKKEENKKETKEEKIEKAKKTLEGIINDLKKDGIPIDNPTEDAKFKEIFNDFVKKIIDISDSSFFCIVRKGKTSANAVKVTQEQFMEMFIPIFLEFPEVMDSMLKCIMMVKSGMVSDEDLTKREHGNEPDIDDKIKKLIDAARSKGMRVLSTKTAKVDGSKDSIDDLLSNAQKEASHDERINERESLNKPITEEELNKLNADEILKRRGLDKDI